MSDEGLRARHDGRPIYATPTGAPCPRTVRTDGSVVGTGDCLGCGTCLLFGGLFETDGWPPRPGGGERGGL